MSRPYFNYNIDQLLQLFATGSKDLGLLTALEVELQHRSALRAKALARDVSRAKAALGRRVQKEATRTIDDAAWRAIFKGGRPPGTERTIDSVGDQFANTEHNSAGLNETASHIIELVNPATEMKNDSAFAHRKMTQQESNRLAGIYENLDSAASY